MARVPTSMSPAKPEGSKKPGKPVKAPKKEKLKPASRDVVAPVLPAPPANRFTIALPFSQIRTQEPSAELADLVTLVGDLVTALKDTLPAVRYEELQVRPTRCAPGSGERVGRSSAQAQGAGQVGDRAIEVQVGWRMVARQWPKTSRLMAPIMVVQACTTCSTFSAAMPGVSPSVIGAMAWARSSVTGAR